MDRHQGRRERLISRLTELGLDAFLILSEANVRYLTGFTGDHSWLILSKRRAWMISDGRFTTQLLQECSEIEPIIRPIGQPIAEGAGSVLDSLALRKVGTEAAVMTVEQFDQMRTKAPTVEWLGQGGWVEAMRMIKDEQELRSIRLAIETAENAFLRLQTTLRPDQSEKDVADRLEWEIRRAGGESASFPPIVASGARAALPHARPSGSTRLDASELLLIDWGVVREGYGSDLTRVVSTGKVTLRFEQVYRTVLAAQERAIAAIRPGVAAMAVDDAARSVIEQAGFGAEFSHGTGHGIGLEIHEAPWMRQHADILLQSGMVVTVEPGIYLPDWGGVRIEDDVLVGEEGPIVLSKLPKSFETLHRAFSP